METQKSGIGSTIGTIVIIAIIILGGLYFWGKRVEESKTNSGTNTTEQVAQSEASIIKSTSPSDDLSSIEAALQTTNTDNLNSEISVQAQ